MAECEETSEEPCEDEIDAVSELLHSDVLDREEELQHAFEEAIEQCKSKGGLTRHKNAKHERHEEVTSSDSKRDDNDNIFSIDDYINLINQSCKSLGKDTCYAMQRVLGKVSRVTFLKLLERKINKGFLKSRNCTLLSEKEKLKSFMPKYFATVVYAASEYFPQLPFQFSVLLATRLADKIASFEKVSSCKVTSEHKSTQASTGILNEKEKSPLQYLGGYVLFTLHKRIRNSKAWMTNSKQQVLALLQAGKQSHDCETAQTLVDCINRGGLWKISQTVKQIFTMAEINFKSVTIESEEPITKISKTDIVYNLEKNVSKDILHQVLLLYIKVRSFSFAKDVINKHKAQQKSSKSKALRKEIKNSSDKPPINE
ncbi:uncharacterized protein LOC114536530 [Dendronephthya gigantea]|uniref:uncharacterized protein LOC114536530 n=1 Tax=Dendronephthya gigantea TaxID=151771 RepID=UPI00106D5268|nr:uncharacterized protein LOC114536530 [Dendronephthya gigantea]